MKHTPLPLLLTLALGALLAGCASTPASSPASTPAATPPASESAAEPSAPVVNVRPDDRASEQPFTVSLLGTQTEFRLGYELSLEQRGNFDLVTARDRDRRVRDEELKLEARMRAGAHWELLAEGVALRELRRQPATGVVTRTQATQRGQLWAMLRDVAGSGVSVQAGRVALVDRRAWWWDDDLDAVRVLARGTTWRLESGFGRELARKASTDPGIELQHRGVRRWFGQASWRWRDRQTLEAFALRADDRSGTPLPGSVWRATDLDPLDGRLRWIGLRASGNGRRASGHRWAYWADGARLGGRQTLTAFGADTGAGATAGASRTQTVRAHAFDLGAQWTWPWPLRPTATLAFARGSGAVASDTLDRNFHQTGLHENKARLGGVKRLRRYGELLDPELSNLDVATVGLAFRLKENTSIELLRHQYRQGVASTLLSGARLSQAPTGLHRDIGVEWDLFLAWREWRELELTLSLSRFQPGQAYAPDRRDPARGVELGMALNF